MSIGGGAYWRGDSDRAMLATEFTGVGPSRAKKKAESAPEHASKEAAKRDHRKLGREMTLFQHCKKKRRPRFLSWHPKPAGHI